ncbi:MAG: YceI family protein [Steroidobacteraceae bacterium]|nr:YceI family protein [Steroidobacteraceae bacterium]
MNPRHRAGVMALLAALALGPAAPDAAAATAWTVDPARSQLTFHPRLAGGEFAGRFERFDATIRFDPADLAHSSLLVVVDLLGARTGDTDRDTALQGRDFFETARWPRGTFASTGIKSLGNGRFEATGKLTLREVTREVRVQFHFDSTAPAGGAARMVGPANVRRLEFGVGQGDWRGTEWLDDGVRVEFDLALRAAR